MKRIVHLIPYDGIGGVEIAAKSIPCGAHGDVEFQRHYLVKPSEIKTEAHEFHGPNWSQNNPFAYILKLWGLLRNPPDLLVASLWRSALLLIIIKMLRRKQKVVIFLHLSHDVHWVDGVVNRLAIRLSDEIWTDSSATLRCRIKSRWQIKARVISFLLERKLIPKLFDPEPNFIFWGRLNSQKGLDRALKIFAGVCQIYPSAKFSIIGPDGGVQEELQELVAELGLTKQVRFLGKLDHQAISRNAAQASFYLQTSHDEGMALSVVEAMQAGLVPVVTPVGEIANYCEDGSSSVFVLDNDGAIERIASLLSDPVRFKEMSRSAAEYWQSKPIYKDSFLVAAKKLLDVD